MKKTAFVTGLRDSSARMVNFLVAEGWNVIGEHRWQDANSFPKLKSIKFVRDDLADGQRVERTFEEYQPTHAFRLGANVPLAPQAFHDVANPLSKSIERFN